MLKARSCEVKDAKRLNQDWKFELKEDGFRAFWLDGVLFSERAIRQSHKFPQIVQALKGEQVVLDGEVCLTNGTVHLLNRKENWNKAKFVVFDLLKIEGKWIGELPLFNRQGYLRAFVKKLDSPHIQFVQQFNSFEDGWNSVMSNNHEGLIAKHQYSNYPITANVLDKVRSKMWLKIKNKKEVEIIMSDYEEHQDNTGITFTDGTNRFSCRGDNSILARKLIAEFGKVLVEVQYLYRTASGKYFQPIVKRVRRVM